MTIRSVQKLPVTGLDDPNQRRRQIEVVNQITEPPTWIASTLENSWVNFGGSHATAGYYKDALGRVYLKGMIKDGTMSLSTTMLTLPAGYRPLETHIFCIRVSNSGETLDGAGRVDVGADGTVKFIYADITGAGTGGYLSLAGISFLAEQ
jgi:hypothetical protein